MSDIDRRIEGILTSIEALTERQAETDRLLKESIAAADKRRTAQEAEDKRRKDDLDRRFKAVSEQIGGISNSNGEFAEEYFENIYFRDSTFAGMHFHEIIIRKRFTDRNRTDEFDIIMLNETNAVIVETKYKAKESDIEKLIKKAESFRYWFTDLKDHKIYLCLASLRFEDNIIGLARKRGIAVIRQLGGKTVANDEHLTAY